MATDNFNRANETPIASPWTVQTGTDAMRLISNEVLTNISANHSAAYHSSTPGNGQYSQIVLSNTIETGTGAIFYGVGPAVRMTTGDTRKYSVSCRVGQILLLVWDNVGGPTQLGSTFAGTVALGDTIRLEASGTTIRVLQNAVQRISVTDSTLASGRVGIQGTYSNDTTSGLDNWDGGALASGPPMDTDFLIYQITQGRRP